MKYLVFIALASLWACQSPEVIKADSPGLNQNSEFSPFEAYQDRPVHTTLGFERNPDRWIGELVSIVGQIKAVDKWADTRYAYKMHLYPGARINQPADPRYPVWVPTLFEEALDLEAGDTLMVTGLWKPVTRLAEAVPYTADRHLLGICFINLSKGSVHYPSSEAPRCQAWLDGENPAKVDVYLGI